MQDLPSVKPGASLSSLHKHSHGIVQFSFNGEYVAIYRDKKLSLRDVHTMSLLQVYTTMENISSLAFSPSCEYILLSCCKRNSVQVFSIRDSTWNATITEGTAGLIHALWTPDSKHIITISDFQLQITIWNLQNQDLIHSIRRPKLKNNNGIVFDKTGEKMAVVEREHCKDSIGIYCAKSWEMLYHFNVDTYDVMEIVWTESGTLLLRDSNIQYNLCVYSPIGNRIGQYCAYTGALGIKTMSLCPTGTLLALGSYDMKIRILNTITWSSIAELDHNMTSPDTYTMIGYEEYVVDKNMNLNSINDEKDVLKTDENDNSENVSFITYDRIPKLTSSTIDYKQANVRLGVGILSWSFDGRFLASRNDSVPNGLWIWDMTLMRLHSVIVLLDSIRSMKWDPISHRLALCATNNRVYLWTTLGTSWIHIPAGGGFGILGLRWHPTDNILIALGKEELCSIYL